jgi:RNA polymerase sigma-70 factor (ECF subfamily)
MQEKELVERAQAGDRKSLAQLVKNHEQTVYNFAFKICRDKEKAENTMQETFLNMVKSLHQFDGKSKLSTWLYRIVVNNCLMMARSSKKYSFIEPHDDETPHEERYVADWEALPTKSLENKELRNILDNAIQKLSPDYRVVFLLRDVEQLSTEETANITELTVPAVKSRLHRARAFLRNEISEAFKQ